MLENSPLVCPTEGKPEKGGSDFSHKNGVIGKIGGLFFKKMECLCFSLLLTLYNFIFHCVSLLIYTNSMRLLCVSEEKLSPIQSNQQICEFCKGPIFEKQNYCRPIVGIAC